jgi:hypothetical protein
VLQFGWSPAGPEVACPASFRIHYRTFSAHAPALAAALATAPDRRWRWSDTLGLDAGDPRVLSRLLLKAALMAHPRSIVLFSSRSPANILDAVRTAEDAALLEPAARLRAMIAAERAPRAPGPLR